MKGYNKESVKYIILNEGLLYAIMNFMDETAIDKSEVELRKNWAKARNDIRFLQDFMDDTMKEYYPAILIYKDGQYKFIVDPDGGEYREAPITELPPAIQGYIKNIHNTLMKIVKHVGLDEKEYGAKFAKGGMIQGWKGFINWLNEKF